MKTIIREVAPEHTNAQWYFDGDCFNENSGDYCNTIFILSLEHCQLYPCCLNESEFKHIQDEMRDVFWAIEDEIGYGYKNVKEVMNDYKLHYTPKNAHELKDMVEKGYEEPEVVARYLSLKTGKPWDVRECRGYCQGDYVEVIYCMDNYTEKDADIFGDIANGCFKEFGVIELDDDGNEVDSCYGYYVTDTEAWKPEDIKHLVCKWSGCDENITELHLCGTSHTVTTYDYDVY